MPVILLAGLAPSMHHRHHSYLRPHRRRWGLTQQELAFLIGVKSRTAVSRIEGSKRRPSLDAVFLCMLIFNMPALELFPGLISELRASILSRASELYEELQGDPSKATRIKLDFLERLLARVERHRIQPSA
ncbi:helix-turn-helix transcriptional regulator [Bradyrhizobium diazoefficiens]|nr:helix-turn-helix transcriptional regulator [Bradyrhizobium diazoefficiens]MCD9296222.1 helix-turn-helix transcriptional regulator [Bradyrhizobium diazoefficiens]MCD9813030.1 helix-turn-helix transcriptional regulator [Bradyrhizobium diazoefficiens]MCD9831755.1 helix-turn-helix transcriptional regulator [Bradyrhizobium diazoefficiens]MCD9849839.1 helix-turn-helix transcriptional regulator [Bradyrhizobium diazoefficiens]MCD9887994.1 helix-turn-helix transcriptional regulator [Bradyrhizobium d